MKFKSEVVTQVSGSVGGVTYAHNRGGMYRRARSIPVNPQSAAQVAARDAFGTLASRWRDVLTEAQRDAWTAYALNSPVTDVFGDSMLLSGQQMFIRCNTPRMRAGLAVVDSGPTTFGLGALNAFQISASIGLPGVVVLFSADPWTSEDDAALIVQTSMFKPPSINFFKSPFRFLAKVDGDSVTPVTSPQTLSTANAFGELAANATLGDILFGRAVVSYADGRLSQVLTFRGVVIA